MDATSGAAGKFGEGRRLGLVASDVADRQAAFLAALEQLGYVPVAAASATDALERLRREAFDVLVLDEEFQAEPAGENPVLEVLRSMPMTLRRHVFVALVGREYKTFDNMMAFTRSVTLVVNVNDLAELPAILKRGMADHTQFYRVFRQALDEAGKA